MKKYRVLLVDDEIKIREGFKKLFDWKKHGCEVVGEAGDGIHAIGAIGELNPDIVIMDINIPFMNGIEVIRRAKKINPQIAFIIVSGYDDFSYCREALRLKVEEYILKPVDFCEFAEVLDNLKISVFRRFMEQNITKTAAGEGKNPEKSAGTDSKKDAQLKQIYGITNYIQEHLSEDISLKLIADEFHLNDNYVSHLFKSEVGVNYLFYLTNVRIEKVTPSQYRKEF